MQDLELSNFLFRCGIAAGTEIRQGLFVLSDEIRDGTASAESRQAAAAFLAAAKEAAAGRGEPRMQPYGECYKQWVMDHPKS